MTPRETLYAKIDRIAFWHGVGVADVMGRDRHNPQVAARRDTARYLRGQGRSFPEIGRILNRDHTTIINLVHGKGWKCLSRYPEGLQRGEG